MITVTGKLEDSAGNTLHKKITFISRSTPQAKAAGVVITNTTRSLFSDPNDGTFSIALEPGDYQVVYGTTPKATDFLISLAVDDDGTTKSIDQVITTAFATLPSVAPYTVWNGVRQGHITFDPVTLPTPFTAAEVDYPDSHLSDDGPGDIYHYAVTFQTEDGETNANNCAAMNSGEADKAIRLSFPANVSRVTKIRLWRTDGTGSTRYLLAEVEPTVDHYDDWESNSDFHNRRDDAILVPDFNTTAGIINSIAGNACAYFSINGFRALIDAQFDAGVYLFADDGQRVGISIVKTGPALYTLQLTPG